MEWNNAKLFSEQSAPSSGKSYSPEVVEVLFWPRTYGNNGVVSATSVNSVATPSSVRQQLKIGFVVGWRSDNFTNHNGNDEKSTGSIDRNYGISNIVCKNMIVAGVIDLPLCDENTNKITQRDLDTTRNESSVMKILRRNHKNIQTMYDTICSNLEYLGYIELPKSQKILFQDLSILGFFIDSSGSDSMQIGETNNEEILQWLPSVLGVGIATGCKNTTPSSSSIMEWKLFLVQHDKLSPPKVMSGLAHAARRADITKQVVYYNSNTYKCFNTRNMKDVENIQVLWNHSGYKSYSFSPRSTFNTGNESRISYLRQQQQPWLIRLTHAAFITQLVMNCDTSERINPGPVPVKGECRSRDDSIKSETLFPIQFLFRHSLFARHCYYNNYFTSEDRDRSVFPIVNIIRRVLSKLQQIRRDRLSLSLLPIKTYEEIVHEHMIELEQSIQLYIDTILGIIIGSMLFYYGLMRIRMHDDDLTQSSFLVATALNTIRQHYELLFAYIKYLEDFPLGFKLNQDLLYNIGCEVQRIWKLHEYFSFGVILPRFQSLSSMQQSVPVLIMSLFAYAFGASGFMAFSFDVIHFGTLHLSIFAWFTIRIYFYELYLLSTLWKLFRGKKCNILRNHRTDSMEYDSMQLLVGTIFFAIVLFLFTTVFVGHIFYTILYFITVMMALPILLLYTSLQSFPWGILWLRRKRPGWFTREIYLTDVDTPNDMVDSMSSTDATNLCYRPYAYQDIIADTFFPRLQGSIQWIIQLVLLSMVGASTSWNDFLDTILPMPQIS